MAISSGDVLHVAKLANLSLDEEEVDRMSTQLSGILEHVDALSTLDLSGVPPTSHPLPTRQPDARPTGRGRRWPLDEVLAKGRRTWPTTCSASPRPRDRRDPGADR